MIQIEPFSDLVFVHMPGCGACEEAMPELAKFESASGMLIMRIRADGPLVERLLGRKRIKATPTYVFRRAGQGYTHEGMMDAKAIAKWIETITSGEEGGEE
jgi:hypothetical protein